MSLSLAVKVKLLLLAVSTDTVFVQLYFVLVFFCWSAGTKKQAELLQGIVIVIVIKEWDHLFLPKEHI